MDNADLVSQARALSGENFVGARQQFPTIKFMGRQSPNGEMGKYYLLKKNSDGNLDSTLIGEDAEVTILRVRAMLDNKEDGEDRVYSYEFQSTTEPIVLKAGSGEPFQMAYSDARQKYPTLKYFQVVHVAYAGQLCKMKIGGGSLANLFDYFKTFSHEDTFMRYKTKLGRELVKHNKGDYYAVTFTRGEVDPNFAELLNTVKQLSFPSAPAVAALPAPTVTDDTIQPSSPTEEEINIEDIPF